MAVLRLSELVLGMVLEKDVRDRSGRLLLTSGQSITAKHLNIFKTWGVTEVHAEVQAREGDHDDGFNLEGFTEPELAAAKEKLTGLVLHNDPENPVIRELYQIALERVLRT